MFRLVSGTAMPSLFLVLAAGTLATEPRHAAIAGAGAVDEPALQLEIVIGGAKFDGEAGRELEVTVDGKPVELTVHVKPHRRFAAAGVAFDYPRGMRFGFESEDGVDMWTLVGESCLVMVQKLPAGKGAELAKIVLDEILAESEGETTAPERTRLRLGTAELEAWQGRVAQEEEDWFESWTVCGLDVGGRPVMLLLQDMPDAAGETTDEIRALLALLAKTFEIGG